MKNIKVYDYQDDFSEAEGQNNYVMSIEPGVAYVRENTSVKYNMSVEYDLVVELGHYYTADSRTSEFIDALYNNTLSSFKILLTSQYNEIYDNSTGESLSECVIDETWSRYGYIYYNNRYNINFQVYNSNPKEYGAYIPME